MSGARPTALITGVAGALASKVAADLSIDHDIVGLDTRSLRAGRGLRGTFHQVKHYAQRQVAEVFRQHRPQLLVHFGSVPTTQRDPTGRFTQNVLGTRNLLRQAETVGTERIVVQSTYHVYGAWQANPIHLGEDAPLRATQVYPQLADVVEMDHAATTFLWRHPDVQTVVVRICNIVGPSLRNFVSRLLRSERVPRLLGYDPMLQFLHEDDAARAFAHVGRTGGYGVYNLAGEGAVSWSWAIRHAGGRPVSVPHVLAYPLAGMAFRARRAMEIPAHLVDFFRFPVVIDDRRFRVDTGFEPRATIVEALRATRGTTHRHPG